VLFWLLWFGLLLFLAGTWLGVYSWNGPRLGAVASDKGRKCWTCSVALSATGLAVLLASLLLLSGFTFKRYASSSLSEFWGAVLVMGLGALLSLVLSGRQGARFPDESRAGLFYAGLALLALGFAALLWLMLPNQLLCGVASA